MSLPFVARSAFDERGKHIESLEAELARLRSENHDLVNAMTANNRVIQPFATKEPRAVRRPPKLFSVYQREQRLTRANRSDYDKGILPGKPPNIS